MEKQISLVEFAKKFGTDAKCAAHLESARWPNGVRCLKCDGERISRIKATGKTGKVRSLYLCLDCEYQFSVTVGTIFHDSHLPLTKWFLAIRLICSAKKGVSARQLARELDIGVESAWYMGHRIRVAMKEGAIKLTGIVEVDETFIGGKVANRHVSKRGKGKGPGPGGFGSGKAAVIGAVQRNGKVVARVIEKNDTATLDGFVREVVAHDVSLIATDENPGYRLLKNDYPYGFVRHGRDEYVVGAIHTNTIEGFWSLFKRGIVGSFHKVSKKYLPLYVAEFQFRYNLRENQAGMFDQVLVTCG